MLGVTERGKDKHTRTITRARTRSREHGRAPTFSKTTVQGTLMQNKTVRLDGLSVNHIFSKSNWSSFRYYHSISSCIVHRLEGFPLSSSARRHRSPRIGARVVLCLVYCRDILVIEDIHRVSTKTAEPTVLASFVSFWTGHHWYFNVHILL